MIDFEPIDNYTPPLEKRQIIPDEIKSKPVFHKVIKKQYVAKPYKIEKLFDDNDNMIDHNVVDGSSLTIDSERKIYWK